METSRNAIATALGGAALELKTIGHIAALYPVSSDTFPAAFSFKDNSLCLNTLRFKGLGLLRRQNRAESEPGGDDQGDRAEPCPLPANEIENPDGADIFNSHQYRAVSLGMRMQAGRSFAQTIRAIHGCSAARPSRWRAHHRPSPNTAPSAALDPGASTARPSESCLSPRRACMNSFAHRLIGSQAPSRAVSTEQDRPGFHQAASPRPSPPVPCAAGVTPGRAITSGCR